ncbi:MAG: AsmA-like C-terminal region-containing protein, partial [Saprospiraceae bacterium]|nr:AsmA-like C-terminal region-containing protein [Saprospiraceae bacterium]
MNRSTLKLKKLWKQLFLILILVPTLLVGGLMLYIQSNQSKIIKGEIEKLNKEQKGLVRVGESKLSLLGNFPYISLKVFDVQIFESKEENAPIIMDVKDIYVGFNLSDIINGNYDIQAIIIEEGLLDVVIHEDGSLNIIKALASTKTSAETIETDSSSTNIHLKKIRLKNLNIHSLDVVNNTNTAMLINTAKGGFSLTDSTVAGHIDTDFEYSLMSGKDVPIVNRKHFEFHTDVVFNKNTGIIDIQPSGLVMENGDFDLEGFVDTENAELDLSVKGVKPNFDMFIAFAPADVITVLDKYKNAGEIYFDARINGPFANGNMPFINADFGAGKAFLENVEQDRRIDKMGFIGHFTNGEMRSTSTMEFSLTEMTASLGKGAFKGSVVVKNFDSPEVDMQIDSDFDLEFIADFFELEQVQNASGNIALTMNFHDIIDIDQPEKALQKLNQAYYAALKIENLSLQAEEFPTPLDNLNMDLVMNGKEATLKQFDLSMGNSDLSISGFLSDLPAIVHHTDKPVEAHLEISSGYLDISELTAYSDQDSIQRGVDEQVENLRLGLSFIASAKDFTESKYLPQGEFFIDSLTAGLKHYPHELHDFHADILIDSADLKLLDFTGYIDDSDFHFDGLIHDYAFWMQPELNGDVDLDINLTSNSLRLEDVFSYKGENYVPEEYRHEVFDNLALHFASSMHYKDSALHSIDLTLDKLDTKMELHSQRFHDFRGNIHYEDEHIVISDFHGEIGTTNFNFDLNYYLGKERRIKKNDNYLEVRANYIDYDSLFDFDLGPPSEATVVVESELEDVAAHAEAFNLYELPFTDMRFKVDVGHFIYHRLDLQNIKAEFRATPDHYIYIDTFYVDAAGGDIQLTGYFNGSDPKHIYMQPDLAMNDVDLDQLLFKFENFGQDHLVSENLKGKLTTRVTGKIRMYPDMVPDLDQSFIEMDVKVLDGELKNYDPMLALSDYMGDKDLRNIRFDTLQNSLGVNKGEISIPSMIIESTIGHIELSGKHDSAHNIDYYLRIPRKTVRQAAWSKLFRNKEDVVASNGQDSEIEEVDPNTKIKYLNLKIEGNLDDYKISLGKKKGK